MRIRPKPDRVIQNAQIILALLNGGYAHACDRCERPIHVKYASGLCVWCFNGVTEEQRPPMFASTAVALADRHEETSAPHLEPAPAV